MPQLADLRLDGFAAADKETEEAFYDAIEINDDLLIALAEHHTTDGASSFHVLHDPTITWAIPGEPQLIALHLQRDPTARTYRFDYALLPLPAMAQSWLIARGCPKDAIGLLPEVRTQPGDATTRALEERLISGRNGSAFLISETRDVGWDVKTTVLVRAPDEHARSPFRVLYEEVDADKGIHTLREGGFQSYEAAMEWWRRHGTEQALPLPPVEPDLHRTQAPAAATPPPSEQRVHRRPR